MRLTVLGYITMEQVQGVKRNRVMTDCVHVTDGTMISGSTGKH